MQYWSWWLSGLALSGVMLLHWFLLKRMMAVSGRLSSLVDFFRQDSHEPMVEMSTEEMLVAIREAAAEELGLGEVNEQLEDDAPTSDLEIVRPPPPLTKVEHVLFMGGLVLGGVTATVFGGRAELTMTLASEAFSSLSGDNDLLSAGILLFGGMLVGFGTRMSGGCTSGHGLCGMSQIQPGSLAATASFFGAGIITSFVLGAFL